MHGPMKYVERSTDDHHMKDVYRDIYVFLFEKSIIFTVKVARKDKIEDLWYFYKDYIPVCL